MSVADESEETGTVDKFCASCGKSELDDVKLMECDDCKSVRYCRDDTCKEDHRSQHEAECKDRAADLRDEILFRQPESTHRGDCPICCVPLPLEDEKVTSYSCCSKLACKGCLYADSARQHRENIQVQTCPFCRYPLPKTQEDGDKIRMKRVEANDPFALRQVGLRHCLKEEYDKAFDYLTKAAELGDVEAHYNLSIMYRKGLGVEKDAKKEWYHAEEAAIAGHPMARHNLGAYEWRNNKNSDRAVKHWIIAANLGEDESLKELKECYKDGLVSKEVFAVALRGHHAAVNATKSENRESASEAMKLAERNNVID